MATRRRHEPKELGRRLGSADLVKKARVRRSRRAAASNAPAQVTMRKRASRKSQPGLLSKALGALRAKLSAKRKPARRTAKTGPAKARRPANPGWLAKLLAPKPRKRRSEADELSAVRRRVLIVMGLLVLATCTVLGRSVQLQLLEGAQYSEVADRQATMSAQIKAKRGVIKDRHGAELAITVDVDSVYAEPRRIKEGDAEEMAAKLAPILDIPKKRIERRLKSDRAFTYLRRRVPAGMAKAVRKLRYRAIGAHPEPKRFYSNVGLASHVLGFTNLEGEGKAGIERIYDDALQGSSAKVPGLRDALGNRVFSEGFVPEAVLEGSDITLTLDRHIQHAAERALQEAVTTHKGKSGVALVLEPKSGDVLALASYPSYNPNNLAGSKPGDHLNRAVNAVYEPGSTMKMVTIAAALEEGLIQPQTKIDCEGGAWRYGKHTIHDANHRYDELSITEILQKSSNICSAKIGIMLERERLYQWLRKFGFAERTGIELPGELRGLMRSHTKWRDIALANIAFGQGIAMTPLQIAQAAATIANGGVRMRPRLVLKSVDKRGVVTPSERPAGVRVVSEVNARRVAKMMTEVTKKGGTAPEAAVPGFEVAGKTGTAQKIDPVTRAYSHELFVASFVGFVPADRPEAVILVLIDEPRGSHYGGTVAAPAFRKIALAALASRNIFPDSPEAREAFLTSYRPEPLPQGRPEAGLASNEAEENWLNSNDMSDEADLGQALLGSLSGRAQALLMGEASEGAGPSAAADSSGRMPNFAGLKLHEVLNRSAEVRCDPVVKGSGRVVKQSPKAGAAIEAGGKCTLTLAPRG